jgi:hypothetical protein
MPLPIVFAAAAVVAGAAGLGAGAAGGMDIKKAHDKEDAAKRLHEENCNRFVEEGTKTDEAMDDLGSLELEVLESFGEFSDIVAKIQNAPEFASIDPSSVGLPRFNSDGLKEVAVVAKAAIGGIAGAAAGTAGGFAAAGAATSIVAAIGTASTGTAISTLSGAAAANATLAALGGGAVAAGGGGMAAGAAVLGGAAAGAGILVGGVIVNVVGRKLAEDADELERQVNEEKESVDRACALFWDIRESAGRYHEAIESTHHEYVKHLGKIIFIVNDLGKTDWIDFSDGEKKVFENTVLLVGLLFKMCQTNLVIDDDGDGSIDRVNHDGIDDATEKSHELLERVAVA